MAVTSGDTLRNHWRPATPEYLTWHLLFDGRPELQAVAQRYQEVLAGIHGIDIVPSTWLHLTVQGVGPAGLIAAHDIGALVDSSCDHLAAVEPFELTFQPAEVHWEGITLTAGPVEPVRAVRNALRTAIAAVMGADRVPGADDEIVWPHVSLAYANSAVPASALFDAIAAAPATLVNVEVGHTSLIELRREGRRYVWSPIAAVRLGGCG
jgi:hypothetical protein